MASPTAKRAPSQPPAKKHVEIVDPRWLLKALGVSIAGAAVLAYLAVCLLIYQGGWQLLLQPSPTVDAKPSIPFDPIRFDAAETGTPRLTAWWIPAESSPARTILFLHDGHGSLSTYVRKLELLHQANVNIFAIDYRGFGQSDPPHASEARMAEDANAAVDYLSKTRHIPVASIVPYGDGLGAVLAAGLAHAHPELPAVILDNPDPDAWLRVTSSRKSRLMPMRALVQDRFDISGALQRTQQPKLLLADDFLGLGASHVAADQALFRNVSDPKVTVTFANGNSDAADIRPYVGSITRFLDEYAPI